MSAQAWMTPMNWESEDGIDAPLLPGHRVRLKETKVVQWAEGEFRRGFFVRIDDARRTFVYHVKKPDSSSLSCSDHGYEGCDHTKIVHRFLGHEE